MRQQIEGTLTGSESLGEDIYRLTIQAPAIAAAAKPGQFVMVRVNGLDPLLRRPFSIQQIRRDKIVILFKKIGKGTSLLAKMPVASSIDLLGPLGNVFKWRQGANCLIGGGMGMAPLLFLAGAMAKDGIKPHIMLGARNKKELTALLPDFEALDCPLTYATDDGSMGHKGFIIDCMADALDNSQAWQVFSCGPYPMMRGVASLCRTHEWPCQVSMETMMACGISACLGCTIEAAEQPDPATGQSANYLHVCKEGPIFQAQAIRWK